MMNRTVARLGSVGIACIVALVGLGASAAAAAGGEPQVTLQPSDQIAGVGVSVTFDAAGVGDSTATSSDEVGLVLTWWESSDEGATWTSRNGCGVGGTGIKPIACGTTVTPTTAADDGRLFRAEIVDSHGKATTRAARLTVCDGTECVVPGFRVEPATDLVSRQNVNVSATGVPANATFVVSECLTGEPFFCTGSVTAPSDGSGAFNVSLSVNRQLFRRDCRQVACEIRATLHGALFGIAPISFLAVQPDLMIRRRSDGVIAFDNVYAPLAQARGHTIAPDGYWTYAILVQNDGAVADDLTLQAQSATPAGFEVQYFFGYFDVTSHVAGSGFLLRDVQPGASQLVAVRFHSAGAALGASADLPLVSRSRVDPDRFDALRLTVTVTE